MPTVDSSFADKKKDAFYQELKQFCDKDYLMSSNVKF